MILKVTEGKMTIYLTAEQAIVYVKHRIRCFKKHPTCIGITHLNSIFYQFGGEIIIQC